MGNLEKLDVVLEGGVEEAPLYPEQATDYQLLVALVPDIGIRLKNGGIVADEIQKRVLLNSAGYRPLNWYRGSL